MPSTKPGLDVAYYIPALGAMGCFLTLVISLKLILRRMLPRMLLRGLFLPL